MTPGLYDSAMAAKKNLENPANEPDCGSLIGDLDAARIRLLRFAELAAKECGVESLNALSITIGCHLIKPMGLRGALLVDQITNELKAERLQDWTLRYKEIPWGKA